MATFIKTITVEAFFDIDIKDVKAAVKHFSLSEQMQVVEFISQQLSDEKKNKNESPEYLKKTRAALQKSVTKIKKSEILL